MARVAVRLGAGALAAVATGLGAFGVATAIGGQEATADTWAGFLVVALTASGTLVSLAAFGAALLAQARGERSRALWLPLVLFPAVAAFLVLGELFWWE